MYEQFFKRKIYKLYTLFIPGCEIDVESYHEQIYHAVWIV